MLVFEKLPTILCSNENITIMSSNISNSSYEYSYSLFEKVSSIGKKRHLEVYRNQHLEKVR